MEHVHGLGVDPADGMLYAASHYGLFRVPEDGDAERVADRYQDTMGFTVAGPNTFVGSGHPDLQEPDLPTHLGLIRSTDAGETWDIVSLGGEVDFHALRVAHGRIYGWDSTTGRLLVSADEGWTWDTRSTLDLRDLAVHPEDPEVLLATTEQGLLRSGDGGRTWTAVPTAPGVTVLAWPATSSLYGVTPDGAVHESPDGGTTWTEQGSVQAEPEALLVDNRDGVESIYLAVSPATILVSTDGGASFTTRYAG
ncbi:F510_1955 family glycosylhydrolase [Blastococcus sp. TF02A-30]|uniref:F510_1955 family glycosylhydrolase n=1 Tax=Blastococcus sp. TF02A-30 TaxID=2250580 RepID=UPI000DE9A1A2|nr:sialidase family protein [Blastococcus sp. TF02A-30]RBY84450.1 exo-alpha-sialidase [Blastococcus sp. TF02A-30]